ncbi:hypothetical protein LPJGGPFB_04842 [Ensifer adhaerens]|nr:hypothetical protein [Ensifer adhaerens]
MCFHEYTAPSYLISSGAECSCGPYTKKEYHHTQKAFNKLIDLTSEFDEVSFYMCSNLGPVSGRTEPSQTVEPQSTPSHTPALEDVSPPVASEGTTDAVTEILGRANGFGGSKSESAYGEFLGQLASPSAERSAFPDLDMTRNPFLKVPPEGEEGKACTQDTAHVVEGIDTAIAKLHNSSPTWGEGPQVEVGSCASRLRKLAGNLLCCKTYTNYAPIWEEISCLELKKFYLRKTCACRRSGGFSTDEALQDTIIEKYGALQILRRKALKEGIRNPAIRAYVAEANEFFDCFNEHTLGTLNSIESRLGYELGLQ